MSLELDRARIEEVVAAIADRLAGDWLLVGGALAALWLSPRRTTEDLDVVGMSGSSAERFALMDLAGELGLPIEALNSAADFFVFRIPDWRDQVEVLRRGARGTVWRPTPTLFVLLKLGRLSDVDLADCLAAIERADADGLALDRGRLLAALGALPRTEDRALAERRAALERRLRS